MLKFNFIVAAIVVAGSSLIAEPAARVFLHAPAVTNFATHDPSGTTILPDGRFLTPAGTHIPVAYQPYGMAMTRDGAMLFIASDGTGQFVSDWQGEHPKVTSVQPPKRTGRRRRSSGGGADFSLDGATLYWSGGENGTIMLFDVATAAELGEISLNTAVGSQSFDDSYIVDVKTSADGKLLYCADVANFRVVSIDLVSKKVVGSVPVGRYPYALALVENQLYAANIGLFEYSAIPAPAGTNFDPRGITKPAFGYPSAEAEEGVEFEGRKIPGLGKPNVPDSYSVWSVDVTEPSRMSVRSRMKTGLLVGAASDNGKTIGGSAPNCLCSHGDTLFVSDGNNDMIERVDTKANAIDAKVRLTPSPLVAGLRGIGPAGMVVSPDGSRLYVAELSLDAIAVIDTATMRVLGHIPTAWYPYRLEISPDGKKLACICFRGFGNGPNAGPNIPESKFLHMRGVLSILDTPTDEALPKFTEQVLHDNGIEDAEKDRAAMSSPVIPTTEGTQSKEIKYVVFITKENHTFDTIFDRVPGSENDPALLRWGLNQTIQHEGQPTLT
ncbi:MAG TPA: hypothetical protein VHZ30_06005, partial [Verrucomicrobiae bacterium]|nr:hypothetical protein [Verrucomicrobiae bacterium]